MSARQARGQLANLRAMAEQAEREEMHGGGHFIGAGATPSMGLSQFRGGAVVARPPPGTSYNTMLGMNRPLVPYRGTSVSTAIVPYRPPTTGARPLGPYVPRPPTSTVLTTRPSGTIKPYNAAEAQARLNALKPTTKAGISARLAAMGITGARVAAALALGIPLLGLIGYFASGADGTGSGGPGSSYYPADTPPPPPGGDGGDGGDGGVPGGVPGGDGSGGQDLPWWSYLQTVAPKRGGRRRVGGRSMLPPPVFVSDKYLESLKRDPIITSTGEPAPTGPVEVAPAPRPRPPPPPPFDPFRPIERPYFPVAPVIDRMPPPFMPRPIEQPVYDFGIPIRRPRPAPRPIKPLRPIDHMSGSGRSDGRSARAAIVRKVMSEKGLKMIEASKYVKEHGLY